MKDYLLLHIPKTGGTSLLVSGIKGGHHVRYMPNSNFKYITIVRNPIDRTISHFSEINEKNNNKIDKYFLSKYSNFQTKWLLDKLNVKSLKEVKEIIKTFKLYTTNSLPKEFGHFNKTRRIYIPTNKEIKLIEDFNDLDIELYKFVKLLLFN